MGTALYDRMLAFDYGDQDRADLMRSVWQGTPFIADVYTGSTGDDRERNILHWCYETFGPQAFPFGSDPKPGQWYRGNATVNGWTWIGFATQAQLDRLLACWPTPDGIPLPQAA